MTTTKRAAPLYQQIGQDIRHRIRIGEYPAGGLIPPESELVARYDVSRITARRAIQELVTEGLLIGRPGKGTFVRTGRFVGSASLLFVHSTEAAVDTPYTRRLLQGIQQSNDFNAPFRLELLALPPGAVQSPDDTTVEDLVTHGRHDGVLTLQRMHAETLGRLSAMDVPVVRIGNEVMDTMPSVAWVGPDQPAVEVALMHLKEIGCQRIAFMDMPRSYGSRQEQRLRGAMPRLGLRFYEHLYERADWGVLPAKEMTGRLLDRDRDVDAIVGVDDFYALGALQCATERGIRVGKDLAIAGLGNHLGKDSHCGITTVELHLEECSRIAVQLLQQMLAGESVEPVTYVRPTLIRRQTT